MQLTGDRLESDSVQGLAGQNSGRGRLTALAAARLRDSIVLGELAPGSRIPERAICERFNLSRTPLREALKILEAEDLVRLEPHRGAVVTKLTLADVEAVVQVLIGLEAMATDPACARITDEQLQELERLHRQMTKHRKTGALLDYFHTNQAIHQAIVDAAGNPVLSRVYKTESRRIWRYRYASNLQDRRWGEAVREHEQILHALTRRDGPLLRELMRVHMMAGWRVVQSIHLDVLSASSSETVGIARSGT